MSRHKASSVANDEKGLKSTCRAVYLLSWTIRARETNGTAIEKRLSRPQVRVQRCRIICRQSYSVHAHLCGDKPVAFRGFLRRLRPATGRPDGATTSCCSTERLRTLYRQRLCRRLEFGLRLLPPPPPEHPPWFELCFPCCCALRRGLTFVRSRELTNRLLQLRRLPAVRPKVLFATPGSRWGNVSV